jgi:hypothetical protein
MPSTKLKEYRLGDLLWWLRKDDVMAEISELMGNDSVNTNTPGWFQLRTVAAKNILGRMTEAEKKDLRKKGEEIAKKGMPEHLKRK